MKGRGRRLSSDKKPIFPNRRSAVISIAVILFLLVFATIAIDQNNVSRLKKYHKEAVVLLEKGMGEMDSRFSYTEALVGLLDDQRLAAPFLPLFEAYSGQDSPAVLSTLYIGLDRAVLELQKAVFTHEHYLLYAAYFEKIYECEQALAKDLDLYNEKAAYYNRQKAAFPASLAARRLGMESLELFTLGPAIQGRP
ncbi:hypothetical protein [Sphaerochaeta sp. PS]|uniref:hypothetical protein n=1 Tax=Sphaerochaeta sp. PS TaxID=3076336 RepID=UPI0028A4A0CF|nr:hypothetical protein [Sphaerochaeta sp. PS]MDT4761756.1 hypothetical protein [Sphaerochaeta sp. PS]